MTNTTKLPFIKWTGSKRKQASYIVSCFPKKIDIYYEGFVGGGSVIDYCKRCGVKKLIAHSDIKNEASIGLILKLGMTNTNLVNVRNYKDGTKSYENQYELKL